VRWSRLSNQRMRRLRGAPPTRRVKRVSDGGTCWVSGNSASHARTWRMILRHAATSQGTTSHKMASAVCNNSSVQPRNTPSDTQLAGPRWCGHRPIAHLAASGRRLRLHSLLRLGRRWARRADARGHAQSPSSGCPDLLRDMEVASTVLLWSHLRAASYPPPRAAGSKPEL
jgi:hypothetical protein